MNFEYFDGTGETISNMSIQTMEQLTFPNILATPIVLELRNRSKNRQDGVLDDVIVSIYSWDYPIEFMVLYPKSHSKDIP